MSSVEAYRGLVERLEVQARKSPAVYKCKVAMLAMLGFAVLGGAVILALGVSAGLVLLLVAISPILLLKLAKIVWIPIAFGWLVLKALWVKFSPPEGHHLQNGEAPELVAEIERLRLATNAPRLHGIVIDGELNAAAASVPRAMGLLGHRHYLVLGLPLMQLLDQPQFNAVIAHEFGHFGGGHGRFSGWIYRVRVSWYRLLGALSSQRSWAGKLFTRFFDWYAPYFNAYSFVLARDNEYQADAMAAAVMSAEITAKALIRVNIGNARLTHDFWPQIQHAVRLQPQPPSLMYREMANSLRASHDQDATRLSQVLTQPADFEDTHPTLAQRLAALGVIASEVSPPQVSAAEGLLGDLLPQLEQHFSDTWRNDVDDSWLRQHEQHAIDSDRLGELEGQLERTPEEVVEHARLAEELHPHLDALHLYRRALLVAPDHPFVHYRIGMLLLDRDDADGIVHLRRAMTVEPETAEPVLQRLDRYYRGIGDASSLEGIARELHQLYQRQFNSARARAEITARDTFTAHGLDDQVLAQVQAALKSAGKVGCVWIARKQIADDPNGPPHFAVLVKWRGMTLSESSALQRVVDALELPGTYIVFSPGNQRGIARRVRKAAGEPVFRKGWW